MNENTRKELDALAALAGEFQAVVDKANDLADEMRAAANRLAAQSLVDRKISELDRLMNRGEFAGESITDACNRLALLRVQAE